MLNEPSSADSRAYREFAEFLHNHVGPGLSVIGMKLDLLRMEHQTDQRLSARLSEVQGDLEILMEQVRTYSNRLGARKS